MASIAPATLTTDLADALQVATALVDSWTDPPAIQKSAGTEGAGCSVVIVFGEGDALDIQGQLVWRGWRINTTNRNEATGVTMTEWYLRSDPRG